VACGGNVTNSCVSGTVGQVDIGPVPNLILGGVPSNLGIQFKASATPPSGYTTNNFQWVQLITNDALLITLNNNTTQTCRYTTVPPGVGPPYLDSRFPYSTNNPTNDNPSAVLDSTTEKEFIRNFSATMYLMWTPNPASGCSNGAACTVPVPLGSVSWHWSGDAAFNGSSWTGTGTGGANAFQTSTSYPSWNSYSDASSRTCN
jgi:hypothetical protein